MWCLSLRGYLSWWSQYGFSRWWEDGLSKFSANSWISLHSNHPRTCPRAQPPHTHPHTGRGYCSPFIHTVFTCCHAACKLTNPEPSSERKTEPQLLDGETLGAMNVWTFPLFGQRGNMLVRPGLRASPAGMWTRWSRRERRTKSWLRRFPVWKPVTEEVVRTQQNLVFGSINAMLWHIGLLCHSGLLPCWLAIDLINLNVSLKLQSVFRLIHFHLLSSTPVPVC